MPSATGRFCLTYADGVADIDLAALLAAHAEHAERRRRHDDRGPAAAAVRGRRAQRRRGGARLHREAPLRAVDQRRLLLLRARGARPARRPTACSSASRWNGSPPRGDLRAFRHEGSGTAWTPTRTSIALNDLWARGAAPWKRWTLDRAGPRPGTPAPQSVLVTGAHGLLGAWLTAALLDAGAPGRGDPPRRAGRLDARAPRTRRRGGHRARRHLRGGPGRPGAQRVRGRQRLSPGRPDPGRAPPTTPRARRSRPTSAAPGCSWRRAAPTARARRRRLLGQGLRPPGRAALPRGPAAAPDIPLRRLQGRRGPDRAVLLAHLRAAGGGHALREPLRRRRHQPLAARARGGGRGAGGPRAGDPLRRLARARLPLRRGRGGRLPGDLAAAAGRTGRR